MEVLTRTECVKCKGTGKNGLSDQEAREFLSQAQLGGVDDGSYKQSSAYKIHRLQTCSYCKGGYNEMWISIKELRGAIKQHEKVK